jgi:hypothetical protein
VKILADAERPVVAFLSARQSIAVPELPGASIAITQQAIRVCLLNS